MTSETVLCHRLFLITLVTVKWSTRDEKVLCRMRIILVADVVKSSLFVTVFHEQAPPAAIPCRIIRATMRRDSSVDEVFWRLRCSFACFAYVSIIATPKGIAVNNRWLVHPEIDELHDTI